MGSARSVVERGTEAFNAHDEATLRSLTGDGVEAAAPGGMNLTGVDALMDFNRAWWQGFPDARAELLEVVESGDTVVVEGVYRGTHTGTFPTPMGDVPATNRKIDGRYAQVFVVTGGRVSRQSLYFDRLELMEQLGLVPQPAAG